MDRLVIQLLGGFAVAVDDRAVPDGQWRLRRAADLLKMLALAPRHRVTREQVIEAFWPDLDPDAAAACVRKAAHHARRVLGVPEAIVLADGLVQLAPGHAVTTDVAEFRAAARAALDRDDPASCRATAGTYGDLLPDDPYAEWCRLEREELRSLHRELLAAGELWGRLVQEVPTHEPAHRAIMRGQLRSGDRAGAIRQFGILSTALRDEMGVSPEAETIELYEQVLAMDGRLAPTPEERARALLTWGLVHWRRADLEEASRTAAEARALAVDARLPRELADASELLGLVAYAQGAWREVFAREFLDAVSSTPDLAPFIVDANMCMSEFALAEPTGTRDMAALAEEVLVAAADRGSLHAGALGHLLRGEAALLADAGAAQVRADLARAAELHEATASMTGRALSLERLAQHHARAGRAQEAHEHHRSALLAAERTAIPEHLLPWIYGGMLEGASPDAALRIVAEAEEAIRGLTPCDPCAMALRIGASLACSGAGEPDRSAAYLAEADRVARMWSGGPWHAAVDEAEAELCRARGASRGRVSTLLGRAADTFTAADRPREAARCRAALATL